MNQGHFVFGSVTAPPSSVRQQTATFVSADWRILVPEDGPQMYLCNPDTCEPVELPSMVLRSSDKENANNGIEPIR